MTAAGRIVELEERAQALQAALRRAHDKLRRLEAEIRTLRRALRRHEEHRKCRIAR